MNVAVTLEHRFDRTPDGAVWTQTIFPYRFWTRYLDVFDQVHVVARVRDVAAVSEEWQRVDGQQVAVASVPYFLGPEQYLRQFRSVGLAVRNAVNAAQAIIFRVGSPLAARGEALLRRYCRPYGLEVVGDPYEVFAPGGVKHPFRRFFRWWFSRQLQQQCLKACAVAYVTEHALQRRYPTSPGMVTAHYSDVELSDVAITSHLRSFLVSSRSFTLITVGSLAQLYKAPDVLIDAVGMCVAKGLDLRLIVVGDGKHRTELEERAASHGLRGRVSFLGQVSAGQAVRTELDQADLFILPSRTEGLPRAMIEAMARGLPCIGSTVGGIPELLPVEDLVPAGDVVALAAKIREIVTDPVRMAHMSARNLMKAREYQDEMLRERRIVFYQAVRERTAAWLAEHGAA